MNNKQRFQIIKRCKKLARRKGVVNISEVTDEILKGKPLTIVYDVLAKQIEEDKKYSVLKGMNDYEVKVSPNYINEWRSKIKIAVLTMILSIVSASMVWRLTHQQDNQKLKQLNHRMDVVNGRIDSLSKLPIFQDTSLHH